MRLREHIFNFFARIYIPVGNVVFSHFRFPLVGNALSFSYAFHYSERKRRLNTHINKTEHNIVTGTNRFVKGGNAVYDKVLRIVQPNVRTVRKTRNTNKLGKRCGICVNKHLTHKFCSEFRHGKRSDGAVYLLACNAESLGCVEKAHSFGVCKRNFSCVCFC